MFDALFGNNMPNAPGVDLDPGTKGLIGGLVKQGMGSDEATAGKLNAGVGGNQFGGGAQDTGDTGASSTQLQAIRNLYGGVAQKQIANLTRSNMLQAPMIRSGWMDQAAKFSMAQNQVAAGIQERLMNANNDYQMARAGALAGTIGSLGGPMAQGFGKMGGMKSNSGSSAGMSIGGGMGSDTGVGAEAGGDIGSDLGGGIT